MRIHNIALALVGFVFVFFLADKNSLSASAAPYPFSAKLYVCESPHIERYLKIKEELEYVFSDVSVETHADGRVCDRSAVTIHQGGEDVSVIYQGMKENADFLVRFYSPKSTNTYGDLIRHSDDIRVIPSGSTYDFLNPIFRIRLLISMVTIPRTPSAIWNEAARHLAKEVSQIDICRPISGTALQMALFDEINWPEQTDCDPSILGGAINLQTLVLENLLSNSKSIEDLPAWSNQLAKDLMANAYLFSLRRDEPEVPRLMDSTLQFCLEINGYNDSSAECFLALGQLPNKLEHGNVCDQFGSRKFLLEASKAGSKGDFLSAVFLIAVFKGCELPVTDTSLLEMVAHCTTSKGYRDFETNFLCSTYLGNLSPDTVSAVMGKDGMIQLEKNLLKLSGHDEEKINNGLMQSMRDEASRILVSMYR